mmetsp:Transcript_33178/g.61323  ORF Transcript_33178/g.61323 Transcript_33178/m.61323 type:complete len:584 (-) Transcript_33178:42-1793(-)
MPTGSFAGTRRFLFDFQIQCRKTLDQRFAPDEEAKYQQSLEHRYIFPGVAGGLICAFLSGSASISTYSKLTESMDDDFEFMLAMVGTRLLAGFASLTMVIACLLKWIRKSVSINLEAICMVWTLSLVVSLIWFNAWHGCLLFGKDPEAIFAEWIPSVAEGHSLLYLSTVINGCCLIVPLPCHLSWIVPAFGMISYICVVCICGSASQAYLLANVASIFCSIVCTLYGSYHNEMHRRREWLAQRKVGTQQDLLESQYHGVCRVLNLLCDCMIRLGSDLQLLEPSERFAAMLMKAGDLQGASIYDFIPDEDDRERFSQMVVGKQLEGSSHASTDGMFHVNFKDSCGTDFPVDLYHTRIANKDDIEYLVGIVENRAREPQPVMGTSEFEYKPYQEAHAIGFAEELQHLPNLRTGEEEKGSGASVQDYMSGDVSTLGEVSVDIIADPSTGFPIIACSPGFTSLSGPITEKEQLLKFIVDSTRWQRCIEDMLNTFYNSCRNVILEDIVFRKPDSSSEYTIAASALDFIGISLDDDDMSGSDWCNKIVLHAVFHGIRQRHRSKRSRLSPPVPPWRQEAGNRMNESVTTL